VLSDRTGWSREASRAGADAAGLVNVPGAARGRVEMSLRVAFAGTPPFAVSALHALLAAPQTFELCGVLTAPDRRAGRGRKMQASAVKQVATEMNLPLLQPFRICDETVETVAAWRPDFLVVSAYGLILPSSLLRTPQHGCVNIHASLLPRWRGAAPIERCIEAGDAETGVSIMAMDEGCDTGPVFEMQRVSVQPTDTLGSVTEALANLGAERLVDALPRIAAGDLAPTAQEGANAVYATKVRKQCAQLNWTRTAVELERSVRAFNPRPVAHSWLHLAPRAASSPSKPAATTTYVRIWAAELLDACASGGEPQAAAGEILCASEAGVDVRTGCGGVLRLLELQPANFPRQSAAEFCSHVGAELAGTCFGDEVPSGVVAAAAAG
jgi:methionyl-tRNA formyltransferase